ERLGQRDEAAAFRRFERSEAGHTALFMRLALREGKDAALTRLDELATAEAAIVAKLPIMARIH
ncbi:MAG: hypothetical protein L6Q71_11840, partial [Planctomycetes bacterium]|nr:hypothetical protein [Planctomycetota bacterium]